MPKSSKHNKPKKEQSDHAKRGKACVPFDLDWYEANRSRIVPIMGFFFVRYLNLLYDEFEGDIVLCIVLGEIANHNISGFFSKQGSCIEVKNKLEPYRDSEVMEHLAPTNAFSISEASGIPRETVRRKVDKLQGKGWIVKSEQGELFISESVREYFSKGFNKQILTELFETCDCLRNL